ncbi:hypothetical protein F5Y16DRAFT_400195 [Xylariaceae sp. FL0255]|nr:hypothetical protein F5Y16DRAFT_400195 [Xylariaceae sp. FL0255]
MFLHSTLTIPELQEACRQRSLSTEGDHWELAGRLAIDDEVARDDADVNVSPKVLVACMVAGPIGSVTPKVTPDGETTDLPLLVGKQVNGIGAGTYSFPFALLKKGEQIYDCVMRTLREQTGLEANMYDIIGNTGCILPNGEHYITIFAFCGFPRDGFELSTENNHDWEGWHWNGNLKFNRPDIEDPALQEKDALPVFGPVMKLLGEEGWKLPQDWVRKHEGVFLHVEPKPDLGEKILNGSKNRDDGYADGGKAEEYYVPKSPEWW